MLSHPNETFEQTGGNNTVTNAQDIIEVYKDIDSNVHGNPDRTIYYKEPNDKGGGIGDYDSIEYYEKDKLIKTERRH